MKNDLKKLVKLLSYHSNQKNPKKIVIQNLDLLPLQIETKFHLLSAAKKLQLWQLSFKILEDLQKVISPKSIDVKIHNKELMNSSLSKYYLKLSKLFWIANNHLFHSYALYKNYCLQKYENRTTDLKNLADRLLLSILSIPLKKAKVSNSDEFLEFDFKKEDDIKITKLIGFPVPTRDLLIQEIKNRGILEECSEDLQPLYNLLEVKFGPLDLCESIKPILAYISKNNDKKISRYSSLLENVVTMKLLKQLQSVYSKIHLNELRGFLSFVEPINRAEKLIVQSLRNKYVEASIDHQQQMIHFGHNSFESYNNRNQLVEFSNGLQQLSLGFIDKSVFQEKRSLQKSIFLKIRSSLDKENSSLLNRKQLINDKLEHYENTEKLREERERELQEKLFKEKREKEIEKVKEQEEKNLEEKKKQEESKRLEELNKRVLEKMGSKIEKNVSTLFVESFEGRKEELATINIKDSFVEFITKKKKELDKKFERLSQKKEYLERARRENEIPLIKEKIIRENKEYHKIVNDKHNELITHLKNEWQENYTKKKTFENVIPFVDSFKNSLKSKRENVLQQKIQERTQRISPSLEKLKIERQQLLKTLYQQKLQREEEEKQRLIEQQKREEQRKLEEERKKDSDRYIPPHIKGSTSSSREESGSSGRYVAPRVSSGSGFSSYRDDRSRDDRPRDENPRDDRPREESGSSGKYVAPRISSGSGFSSYRDDRSREDRPRDDRPREDRPREESGSSGKYVAPRVSSGSGFSSFRDDRSRDENPRNDRSRDDRPREDRPREESGSSGRYVPPHIKSSGFPSPKDDRPRNENPKDDRPRDENPKDDRGSSGRYVPPHIKGKDSIPSGSRFDDHKRDTEVKEEDPKKNDSKNPPRKDKGFKTVKTKKGKK